jgi:hypothetical protein
VAGVEILKILPQKPEPILLTQIFAKLTYNEHIHYIYMGFQSS